MSKDDSWLNQQIVTLECLNFGSNKKAGMEAMEELEKNDIQVKSKINLPKSKNDKEFQQTIESYQNLYEKSHDCLTKLMGLHLLQDSFSNLTKEIINKCLHKDKYKSHSPTLPSAYQNCMLSSKQSWEFMKKLNKCNEVHLTNASDYHMFFHSIEELSEWMPIDLKKAEKLLDACEINTKYIINITNNENDLNNVNNIKYMDVHQQALLLSKYLLEFKTALAIFSSWQSRLVKLTQQANKLVPMEYRVNKTFMPFQGILLTNYQTKNFTLHEGEEVTVLNNSDPFDWKVKTLKGQQVGVPSILVTIPPPDSSAMEHALKLCFKFLFLWSNMIKRYGKTLILFLFITIRKWTNLEEKMLESCNKPEKDRIRSLLEKVEKTFSPTWNLYKPYQCLLERMQHLEEIINRTPKQRHDFSEEGKLLVVQTIPLEELLFLYTSFWKQWQGYKISLEVLRHPQYLLSVQGWEEYHFLLVEDWLKKWQLSLSNEDMNMIENTKLSKMKEQELEKKIKMSSFNTEKNDITDANQVKTVEQEVNMTFCIKGVYDPETKEFISKDEAFKKGVLSQDGSYFDKTTKKTIAFFSAMEQGLIKGEMIKSEASQEKITKDYCLVTLRILKESRPYYIRRVLDRRFNQKISVEEAIKEGIINEKNDLYNDLSSGKTISMEDAFQLGFLDVKFKDQSVESKPEIITKKFEVTSVLDAYNNKEYSFTEAIDRGLINVKEGSYLNRNTRQKLYLGDAIKMGYIRAMTHDEGDEWQGVEETKEINISEEIMLMFNQNLKEKLKN